MRHPVRLSLALLVALLARTSAAQGPPPNCSNLSPLPPAPTALPFPSGFDYPATDLQAAVNAKNVQRLRQHGWNLWAGINSLGSNGRPVWWSWLTSTYAYAPPPTTKLGAVQMVPSHPRTLNQINHDNTPVQLPAPLYPTPNYVVKYYPFTHNGIPDGVQFQSNGDILVAGVIYNQDAYNWIRNPAKAPLFQASTLTAQLKAGQKLVSPFPSSSIVLKHMYWPVRGDGPTALPVFDPALAPPQPTYYGYEQWNEVVGLDPSGHVKPGQQTAVSYFYGIQTANKTPLPTKTSKVTIAPLQDFYSQKIDAAALAKMTCQDRALLDASALWLYNRPFHAGDYLVTVSMHIVTKEIQTWGLQSFWWSPQPNAGPYAADRPDIPPGKAPGPWRHYLQTIEYGITNPGGTTLPTVYNPYIELAAGHPINTNCRNCHTRAAWPRNGVLPPPQPSAQYQLQDIAKDPGLLAVIPDNSPIFNGLMRVDFQWALSDRAIPVK
jgi:hypothetical protein